MLRRSLLCCLGLLLWGLWLPSAWASPPGSAQSRLPEGSLPERRLLLLVADRLGYPEFSGEAGPVLSPWRSRGRGPDECPQRPFRKRERLLSLGTGARPFPAARGRAYQRGEAAEGGSGSSFQRYNGCLPGAGFLPAAGAAPREERGAQLSRPAWPSGPGHGRARLDGGSAGECRRRRPGGAVLIGMDHRGCPSGAGGEEILLSDPLPLRQSAPISRPWWRRRTAFWRKGRRWSSSILGISAAWTWPGGAGSPAAPALLKETMARGSLLERLLSLLEGDALMLVVPSPPQNINGGRSSWFPFCWRRSRGAAAGGQPTTRARAWWPTPIWFT